MSGKIFGRRAGFENGRVGALFGGLGLVGLVLGVRRGLPGSGVTSYWRSP